MYFAIIIAALVIAAAYHLIRGGRTFTTNPNDTLADGPFAPRRLVAVVLLVPALLLFLFTSLTIVEAKQVGVLTTFGKPSDRTLDPGLHLKAPWQKVTQVDGTIQTDEYRDDRCIYVRIGDGSQSCLTATIRWRIVQDRANTIFGDYRSDDPTENLRSAVVSTQFKSAAQTVLSDYNPIASLEVVSGSNAQSASELNFAPDYDAISAALSKQMVDRLGTQPLVEVQSITVSYLSLADSTQSKLNDFIAAVGDTRIAAQRKSTATEEAAANRTLSGSISNDPNVLTSKCYDVVKEALAAGYQLPAGFSCWPGSGSALVIPSGGAR